MKLSKFGEKIAGQSAIVELMEDLGDALNVNPDLLFLGGGNPAAIPEAQAIFQAHIDELATQPKALHQLLGIYQSPQGNDSFVEATVNYLRAECGWDVGKENISLVNGSQTAFYLLLNSLAGTYSSGEKKQVLLPLVPEYLGYADQGQEPDMFDVRKPLIKETGANRFKYFIDFDNLNLDERHGAICVSRPTNPSGNVISDDELAQLSELARENESPLIIDNAYGKPFPGLIYGNEKSYWDDNTISVLSASKLGLPGARTGIVVANAEITKMLVKANTILSLASGGLGPYLLEQFMRSGSLKTLVDEQLPRFYLTQQKALMSYLDEELKGIPYKIHEAEGAFFLWVWFPELPISSEALYQEMKSQGVLIMAGEHFFFGLQDSWPHAKQCVRLSYCQSPEVMKEAIKILGCFVRGLHA